MTFAQDILSAQSGLVERIGAAIGTYRENRAERLAKKRIYQDTLRELQNLSPRDMADIGIAASQIEAIAHEAAYGK